MHKIKIWSNTINYLINRQNNKHPDWSINVSVFLRYSKTLIGHFILFQFLRVIHAYFLVHSLQFDMQLPCNGYWFFSAGLIFIFQCSVGNKMLSLIIWYNIRALKVKHSTDHIFIINASSYREKVWNMWMISSLFDFLNSIL